MGRVAVIVIFMIVIILISIADVLSNVFTLVPFLGDFFKTLTEIGLEFIQVCVTAIGFAIVSAMKED